MTSLFAALPARPGPEEQVSVLAAGPATRIERIVSTGQASLPGFWYDQEEDEFVALLTGAAGLRFEDEAAPRTLGPGDWLLIPAHRRHRVEWTHGTAPTVWLAVFFQA
ncbi:MAG: cupin domain-containing protein [Rhodospirillaceae bacterium]